MNILEAEIAVVQLIYCGSAQRIKIVAFMVPFCFVFAVYVILGNVEEHIGLLMALEKRNLLKSGNLYEFCIDAVRCI